MSYIFQNSIEKQTFSKVQGIERGGYLDFGLILKVNASTVDVQLDSGQVVKNVEVATSNSFDQNNRVDFIQRSKLSSNSPFNTSSLSEDLPPKGSRVLVGYAKNKTIYPVVIGCLSTNPYFHDQEASTMADSQGLIAEEDKGRKFYLHRTHYWDKINASGNSEVYYPDGTSISVSDSVITSTDELSDQAKFELKDDITGELSPVEAKTIRIKHSSGTCITIKATGDVDMEVVGNSDIVTVGDVNISTTDPHSKMNLTTKRLNLGGATATEKSILGNLFRTFFNAFSNTLVSVFNSHTHATGVGPSGPPLIPLVQVSLSDPPAVAPNITSEMPATILSSTVRVLD